MHYTEVPKVSQFSREPFPHHWERYQKLDGTSVAAEYVLQLFHRYHFFYDRFCTSLLAIHRMRKYYKLILSVITFVSVICFIFYKTQYDRLYNVLEVLEFFGASEKAGIAATGY